MLLRMIAIVFGIVFIFAGVAGFLSMFMTNGLLFGFFEVSHLLSLFYLASGVLAIMAATRTRYAHLYFRVFGVVYILLSAVGFARNGDAYVTHVNMADNILHLVIALIALYFGFSAKHRR